MPAARISRLTRRLLFHWTAFCFVLFLLPTSTAGEMTFWLGLWAFGMAAAPSAAGFSIVGFLREWKGLL